MPTFRSGVVSEIISERRGIQRLAVRMPDGTTARAFALTELIGDAAVGDTILCNTTAVDRALGTGGWHIVHWNMSRSELDLPGPDHVMKLRYTSLQHDAGTSELLYPEATDRPLGGTPVVVCTLHSQMALVALGFAHAARGRRLAYVMTDGASLPIALSDLVDQLRARDLLVGSVTAGNAFGGDLEAVAPAGAFWLAAHVLDADAIVVSMGPGVVGTGTAMGTTALEAAALLDTAARRGGRPLLCIRASQADERPRHRSISHHVESTLALTHCVPVVADVPDAVGELDGVQVMSVPDTPSPAELLEEFAMRVTSMGRGPAEDPVFFRAAVSAGALAGRMLRGSARS